jgi:anaerobic selenocysteine-containing dehydrogenase
VAFSSFLDETALAADLVFPLPLGLERLDDLYTPFGSKQLVYTICPQIIAPVVGGGLPFAEVLMTALDALRITLRSVNGQNINRLDDLFKVRAAQLGADFRSLMRGQPFIAEPRVLPPGETFAEMVRDLHQYADIPLPGELAAATDKALGFAPLVRPAVGTAVSGIPPYAIATVPENELRENELCVWVNAATACRLGLKAGQRAMLSATDDKNSTIARLSVRVALFEGIMNNVIGLPLGYGREGFDSYSQGKGVNGLDLFSLVSKVEGERASGCLLAVRGLELRAV